MEKITSQKTAMFWLIEQIKYLTNQGSSTKNYIKKQYLYKSGNNSNLSRI